MPEKAAGFGLTPGKEDNEYWCNSGRKGFRFLIGLYTICNDLAFVETCHFRILQKLQKKFFIISGAFRCGWLNRLRRCLSA